ncbi:C-C motif chemokine 5-like [Dromiciops gliroides]|uniref:C-C motif chemokine 5-like n=1 Tax=Dromiciops gliroides TaxID=33562 RepID=UPI001CC63685|nr:C-C motif chemokine 5-like [Dromiciops gliroides]
MKGFAVVFSILLVTAILCTPASPSPYASDTTPCCFSFTSLPPPLVHIREYFYTSSRCGNQGVVFITRKKQQLCANPEKKWVRNYINSLEMS